MSQTVFLLILFGLALLIPTAYAAKIGAPYAPTFSAAIRRALQYVNLGDQDVLVDIGAGDGRVLLEANRRGAKAIGYELSPIMAAIIWVRTFGKKNISLKVRNFYKQELPPATTVVFAFLMPENMSKVKDFLAGQYLPNARYMLVYAFPFKDVAPVHIIHEPKCARLYIYDLQQLTSSHKTENRQATGKSQLSNTNVHQSLFRICFEFLDFDFGIFKVG